MTSYATSTTGYRLGYARVSTSQQDEALASEPLPGGSHRVVRAGPPGSAERRVDLR